MVRDDASDAALEDEEKRSICLQTTAPGLSVARIAQRYAMNANLIFKRLRDPRYAPGPNGLFINPVSPTSQNQKDGPRRGLRSN